MYHVRKKACLIAKKKWYWVTKRYVLYLKPTVENWATDVIVLNQSTSLADRRGENKKLLSGEWRVTQPNDCSTRL